jgi:phosphoglycerol transferase MdoB-like AlkP superfamily enzyme
MPSSVGGVGETLAPAMMGIYYYLLIVATLSLLVLTGLVYIFLGKFTKVSKWKRWMLAAIVSVLLMGSYLYVRLGI